MPQYAFGWKPSPPDIRDRIFTAPKHIRRALPQAVDLDAPQLAHPWEPVWDQGTLGSCGPQTAAADIVFAQLAQDKFSSAVMPSRLFIYYCTRALMGTVGQDSGVDNRSLLKALNKFGWCDEAIHPYKIDDFRLKPRDECFSQAKERKISEYLSIPQQPEHMKGCLAAGDPFIFGFTVYESMLTDEVARTGDIHLPNLRDRVAGGHDVLVIGYDDRTQRYKIRNSWGRWGKDGYGTIPYAYAHNERLASDFWTVRHSAVTPPTPTPPVPPAPVPPPVSVKRTITVWGAGRVEVDGKVV